MKSEKIFLLSAFVLFAIAFAAPSVSAWWLNGTVYDTSGNVMVNTTVNVSFYTMSGGLNFVGANSTYTNSSGKFSLDVANGASYMYHIVLKHYHNNSRIGDYVDYSNGVLPYFPLSPLERGINTTFFLKQAGVLNLTAVNATGSPVSFNYVIQDVKTGDVIDSTQSKALSAEVVVPTDNNYSITIFPTASMPISYEMDNFSSLDYSSAGISYNGTTHQLNNQFNTSVGFHSLAGNLFYQNGTALTGYSFRILPYYLVGGMLSLGQGTFPADLGAIGPSPSNDTFSSTYGNFSMTVPGPTENASMILLALANDGTNYLIGYRNITAGYSGLSSSTINFTMYPSLGTHLQNLTQQDAGTNFVSSVNTTIAEQEFGIFNSTTYSAGNAITDGVHIEATVDYTNFNATSFKIMADTASGSNKFYLPLINATGAGIKSISLYSHTYSPASLTSLTSPSIISQYNNITMSVFDPQTVGGSSSGVTMALLKSNSTCDSPSPTSSCYIGSSSQSAHGNPLSAIIGGGKVDFMMGLLSSGIIVKYVNVNMIASGPPSAMFGSAASTSTTGGFSSAMKFGSLGPKIYDYAMVSIPYSTSQLDTSATVTASIPKLYLDNASGVMDWNNPVWNTATNGTNATLLADNYSHFSGDSSTLAAWQTLLSGTTCLTSDSSFSAANPCYIDTTNHRIWLRIPHFSGIDPNITGTVVSVSSNSETSSSGSAAPPSNPSTSHIWDVIVPGKVTIMNGFNSNIGVKQLAISVKNNASNVLISVTKYSGKPAEVSVSVNQSGGKVYQYFHVNTTNLLSNLESATITIRVNKTWMSDNGLGMDNVSLYKFNETSSKWMELNTSYDSSDSDYNYYNATVTSFSYFAIASKQLPAVSNNATATTGSSPISSSPQNLLWLWISLGILAAAGIGFFIWLAFRKK